MFRHVLVVGFAVLPSGLAYAGPPQAAVVAGTPALRLVHEGHTAAVQASGTLNSMDAGKHTVNISHGSIKRWGGPP